MSAIRMVAFGVLEYPQPLPRVDRGAPGYAEYAANQNSRKEIRDMVSVECQTEGLLVRPTVNQYHANQGYRTSRDHYTLWGRHSNGRTGWSTTSWVTRPVLCKKGTLRECCIEAVRFLEPDNPNLPTPVSNPLVGS